MSEEEHAAITLTDANFDQEVMKFPGVVFVDFWAAWCGPCLLMAPRIEELARKYASNPNVKIAKMDVDAELQTSQALRILSLPTFKVYVNGQEVDEFVGAVNIEVLDQIITRALSQITAKVA